MDLMMDDLVSEFIEETVESLAALDLDLVRLEKDSGNKELLSNVFRLMHTIKGTCGFIGLHRLEKTAHAAENLLDCFRSGRMTVSEEAMTLLFSGIDRVRALVMAVRRDGAEPAGADDDVIGAIEDFIADAGAGRTDHLPDADDENAAGDSAVMNDHDGADFEAADTAIVSSAAAAVDRGLGGAGLPDDMAADGAAARGPEYLRVQMSVLEELINMVSELVLTRNQLLQMARLEESATFTPPLQRLNRIVSDLQDSVMKTRMQPIGNAWSKLPRIVRDLTTELKKKIDLRMTGEETELDRQVLEMIKDPLTHMIRNSCDHGIENPADRRAAGKNETGTIHLHAAHEGGFIIIRISDDGKGLDAQAIGRKAVEKGMVDADKLEGMTEKQLLQFIMKPGFSTAEAITNVSGRGVGMDVVRANIEKIGGTIDMESAVGKGTVFTIQIPLTLAIISAMIVQIGRERYAIPQLNIQELVRVNARSPHRIEEINGKYVFRLRDKIIPLLDSAALFGEAGAAGENVADPNKTRLVAVINAGSSVFGLIVDKIYDTEEIVIKSSAAVLKSTAIFSGNTILGDGHVIMILDPVGIARTFDVGSGSNALQDQAAYEMQQQKLRESERASMLVFKAGDGAPKAIPLGLISRLQVFPAAQITRSGDKMVVPYDDVLMPVSFVDPDTQSLAARKVNTIILSDDMSHSMMGLVIDEITDIVEDRLDLMTSTARDGIMGSLRLRGVTVDVLDIAYFLRQNNNDWFSSESHANQSFIEGGDYNPAPAFGHAGQVRAADEAAVDGRLRLLIVDDSPFFRNMLMPIMTAAGFNVSLAEDPVAAIKMHDQGRMFDVVLSDIEMPHMDGYQFVETMRNGSSWQHLPFIAITSHNTVQDKEYGYKKGFTQYIGKFDKEELIRTIKKVMREDVVA